MKNLFIRSLLVLMLPFASNYAKAAQDDMVPGTEPEDPSESIEAILYREDTARFDQIIHNYKTLDVFAGATNQIIFRGTCYVVDRSHEVRKVAPSPGNLASGAAATAALVKDLRGRGKGSVQVKITYREYNSNGTIKSETSFEVTTEGSFQMDTGSFDESMNKQHK